MERRRGLSILLAVALVACAGATRANEVAYLVYVKGSEGPPATPMRVLWDVRDDANARITIDLGEKYEPVLTKLGLARVLKYDAKREKAQFVVRDLAFTRFVKTVATSVVQALLAASTIAGAWAQPPDAQVQDAALLITPAYLAKFDMGETIGMKAFFAAIIGGFNQTRGALLGGVLIGIMENVVGYYFSPAYKEGVALVLFLLVILFRPEGLLGRREERKV